MRHHHHHHHYQVVLTIKDVVLLPDESLSRTQRENLSRFFLRISHSVVGEL